MTKDQTDALLWLINEKLLSWEEGVATPVRSDLRALSSLFDLDIPAASARSFRRRLKAVDAFAIGD